MIKGDFGDINSDYGNRKELALDRDRWRVLVLAVQNHRFLLHEVSFLVKLDRYRGSSHIQYVSKTPSAVHFLQK
jgi:hypothetical protein